MIHEISKSQLVQAYIHHLSLCALHPHNLLNTHILAQGSLFRVLVLLLCAFAVFTSLYGLIYQVHLCSYMLSNTTVSLLLYKVGPRTQYIKGSGQEGHNSIANALELCPSWTNPSRYAQVRLWVLVPCIYMCVNFHYMSELLYNVWPCICGCQGSFYHGNRSILTLW